jgi:glutamyl-tRNA synthetase
MALLGWGAGDDQTVLSTPELIERFTLQTVSRNPARFDEVKLKWLNGVYIRELPLSELVEAISSYLDASPHAGFRDDPRLRRAVEISQEKIHTLADFWPLTGPLLDAPVEDPKARERWLGEQGRTMLARVRGLLADLTSFEQPAVEATLEGLIEREGVKPREVYQPLRVALCGTTISPGIFESVALLGREETLRRVDAALART